LAKGLTWLFPSVIMFLGAFVNFSAVIGVCQI
jgi:hypothetical protein